MYGYRDTSKILASFFVGSTATHDAWQDVDPSAFEDVARVIGMRDGGEERTLIAWRFVESLAHAERIAADIAAMTGNSYVMVETGAGFAANAEGWGRVAYRWGEDVDRSKPYTVTEDVIFQLVPDDDYGWAAATLVYPNGGKHPLT